MFYKKDKDPQKAAAAPGDGLRSVRTTMLFRAVNFELYARPNMVIMALGLTAMIGCSGYIWYMRSQYEDMGYYTAVESDGKETFKKKNQNGVHEKFS